MNDFKSERMKKDRTTYAIIILVDYSTFLGNNDVLITKSKRLQIPQPPELEIIEIKYNNVHLKSIKAKVKIRVTNNGPIDLHVTGMKYYITLRGQGKVSGRYAPGIDILPYGTTIVDLPVEINPKKISRTLLDVITNNDTYDYSLNVNAVLSLPDQPGQTFHVDLVKTGRIELKK
ncbi:MAG: LEA type 2 family protein [Bacteroidia bacterium]